MSGRQKITNADKKKLALYAAGTDLTSFAMMCFDITYPRKKFKMNWHIQAVLCQLSLAVEGKRSRLIINIAPRMLKSFLTSVVLPAWILAQNPSAAILCMSYSDDLGKTFSRQFRKIVRSRQYKALFPHVEIGDKDTEGEISTTEGGYRITTSVGGTITGRGADFIIIDDPIKAEDARSEAMRTRVNDWFDESVYSRLDDKEKSVCILAMQRLHENDLTGHLGNDRGFFRLSLSAVAEEKQVVPLGGGQKKIRKRGELLHPDQLTQAALDDAKKIWVVRLMKRSFSKSQCRQPETCLKETGSNTTILCHL